MEVGVEEWVAEGREAGENRRERMEDVKVLWEWAGVRANEEARGVEWGGDLEDDDEEGVEDGDEQEGKDAGRGGVGAGTAGVVINGIGDGIGSGGREAAAAAKGPSMPVEDVLRFMVRGA